MRPPAPSGCGRPHVLFLIVLPQALRIMVPQLTSQYLNLIKSSTLGAVVAYPDLFQIFAGTVMNQSGKEVETILIVMAVFLTINLLFSAFMNWYNCACRPGGAVSVRGQPSAVSASGRPRRLRPAQVLPS